MRTQGIGFKINRADSQTMKTAGYSGTPLASKLGMKEY
jgi:hypothetical protein